jgi:glycosyltransferase involved in cell wall biosynthesis
MRKKVLIAYTELLHYRIPLLNRLGDIYDLTVIHSGIPTNSSNKSFTEKVARKYCLGRLQFQPALIWEVLKGRYFAVIVFLDVAWVMSILTLLLKWRIPRYIVWGPWLTKNQWANRLRLLFINRADASIFYSFRFLREFEALGAPPEKLFVAPNTIEVSCRKPAYLHQIKDQILFVGSLVPRKGNDILLQAFSEIKNLINPSIKLAFIGKGSDRENLVTLASNLEIQDRVDFKGQILSEETLSQEYNRAIAAVSVTQAGLAVLQSMGFGVPFITNKNSISGDEKLNIIHGVNGLLSDDYDNLESLKTNLLRLCNNVELARQLGKNAYEHYQKYCTIENMSQGFVDAIEETRITAIYTGGFSDEL